MEVCWNPCDTNVIILWVRWCPGVRRKEGESLYEPHSEQHHLVPSQGLPHALPLTNTERYQGRMPLVPEETM